MKIGAANEKHLQVHEGQSYVGAIPPCGTCPIVGGNTPETARRRIQLAAFNVAAILIAVCAVGRRRFVCEDGAK